MEAEGRLLHRIDAPAAGHFLAPHVFRVRGIEAMEREVFGPVLHVARFDAEQIDGVIEAVNAKGYGLTFGLHTRVDARVQHIVDRVRCGNIYVNRNQIGAVVGSQPFGGEGLSGTGPKAGGPLYLNGFVLAEGRTRGRGEGRGAPPPPPHPSSETEEGGAPSAVAGGSAAPQPRGALMREADGAPVEVGAVRAAFEQLAAPREGRRDRVSALRASLRGRGAQAMAAAAALDPGPIDLAGPTGESNRYMLVPRGPVLALGPGEAALDQAVQALAAGNPVVAVAPGVARLLEPLGECGLPFAAIDGEVSPANAAALPVGVVAWAGDDDTARALRRALAAREGPIVRLVRDKIAPWEYCHERSICIDTTAAGGNTTLLARAE
jgi:RHH-type proline utilization regulon transcriptional repressor/proline dehydrogenase/delta 1-pyrroline-5-carboxylate dehydrogenase